MDFMVGKLNARLLKSLAMIRWKKGKKGSGSRNGSEKQRGCQPAAMSRITCMLTLVAAPAPTLQIPVVFNHHKLTNTAIVIVCQSFLRTSECRQCLLQFMSKTTAVCLFCLACPKHRQPDAAMQRPCNLQCFVHQISARFCQP